jgi:hypothetical protein
VREIRVLVIALGVDEESIEMAYLERMRPVKSMRKLKVVFQKGEPWGLLIWELMSQERSPEALTSKAVKMVRKLEQEPETGSLWAPSNE